MKISKKQQTVETGSQRLWTSKLSGMYYKMSLKIVARDKKI